MTRNLKALGLALVAMLALGAIGAQGASAVVEHSFRSDAANGRTVLTGSMETSTKDVFSATAGLPVECSVGTFSGTVSGNTVDEVTVHPKYSSCKSPIDSDIMVDTGGCNYVFDSDTTEDAAHSAGTEHARVRLECESAHSATPHAIKITAEGCTISFEITHASSVEVNQSLHGVTYKTLSSADSHSDKSALTVTSTVKTIKYTAEKGSFCGLAGHPAATYSNGTYTGKASVTGYEDDQTPTGSLTDGTSWAHKTQVNISLSTPT